MSLDHSCLTINVIKIEKFKARTLKKVIGKYVNDPKPLLLVTSSECRLFIQGEMKSSISRHGDYKSFIFSEDSHYASNLIWHSAKPYYHPRQTMEAIERYQEISPDFATWLIFNLGSLFAA